MGRAEDIVAERQRQQDEEGQRENERRKADMIDTILPQIKELAAQFLAAMEELDYPYYDDLVLWKGEQFLAWDFSATTPFGTEDKFKGGIGVWALSSGEVVERLSHPLGAITPVGGGDYRTKHFCLLEDYVTYVIQSYGFNNWHEYGRLAQSLRNLETKIAKVTRP